MRQLAWLALWAAATAVLAQKAPPSGPKLSVEQEVRAYQLGKKIRCAVCQGMSAADSPADMAKTMMLRVRELVAYGKTEKEILDHFVARYGEWVLLEPPPKSNAAVWVLPVVLFVGGIAVVAWLVKRFGGKAVAAEPKPAAASSSDDAYRQAIRAEVDE